MCQTTTKKQFSCVPTLVTLTTVYNRAEQTVRCLHSLDAACHIANVDVYHVIVDDNSNDGTSDLVGQSLPSAHILHGNGNLYWSRGMLFGFNYISKHLDYDYLVAYNDDCIFTKDSIKHLLLGFDNSGLPAGIVVGSLISPHTQHTTYGGRQLRSRSRWLPPSFSLVTNSSSSYTVVDSLNMNLCCISRDLLQKIGFLDPLFIHKGADFDFGLRAASSGYKTILAPQPVGTCSTNITPSKTWHSLLNVRARLSFLFSPKQYPPRVFCHYYRTHGGYLWFFWLFVFYLLRYLRA